MHFTIQVPLHRIPIEIKVDNSDEFWEKQAAEGHNLKSLPTLVRALDTAKDYELPLLLGAIEAVINLAPEAYFVLTEENKAKIARHSSPPDAPEQSSQP